MTTHELNREHPELDDPKVFEQMVNLTVRGMRGRSCDATFTRQRLETNQPLPCELCASAAINNVATRAVTSARRFTMLTPMTASRCWRCWAVVPALQRDGCIAIVW